MKRDYFILGLAACSIFLLIGTAQANTITIDGVFGLDEWQGQYTADDGVGRGGFVGPGWGGQEFDVEYTGLYIDNNRVHFGLQTGFDVRAASIRGYAPGDFSLDVNNDSVFDYAIDFSFNAADEVTYRLYEVSEWQDPLVFRRGVPFQMRTGEEAEDADGNTAVFDGAFGSGVFANNVDGGTSYVLEGSFGLEFLTLRDSSVPMTIAWTMGCGNDIGMHTVPEPKTLFLLGSGLIAFAGLRRQRFLPCK